MVRTHKVLSVRSFIKEPHPDGALPDLLPALCFKTSLLLGAARLHSTGQECPSPPLMQAMHDEPSSLEQQLNTDWKLLVARDAFRRFVSAEDVDVRTGRCRVDKVCVGCCRVGKAKRGGPSGWTRQVLRMISNKSPRHPAYNRFIFTPSPSPGTGISAVHPLEARLGPAPHLHALRHPQHCC